MTIGKCEFCEREGEINEHHLIPKTNHSNKWFKKTFTKDFMKSTKIWLCKHDCHPTIHKFFTEKELGRHYNTKELLLAHPKVSKYVEWVKKQVGKTKKTLR